MSERGSRPPWGRPRQAEGIHRASRCAVITTSYPTHPDDFAGHFVRSQIRTLRADAVAVVAPAQRSRVEAGPPEVRWIGSGDAFGAPGFLTRVKQRPLRVLGALWFAWRAARELRRLRCTEAVAHWLLPCGWPIAVASGIPKLHLVAHGSDVRLFAGLPSWLRVRIARSWLSREVRFQFVARALLEQFAGALPPALAAHVRAHSDVQALPFELPTLPERDAVRDLLGLRPEQRLAICVGRLTAEKRVEHALRALLRLPNVVTAVVGDGPERMRLAACFPCARFLGGLPRSQALAYLASADLLVSASLDEGAPTAIREALALGVPAICCPAGDLLPGCARPGLTVVASDELALACRAFFERTDPPRERGGSRASA